MAIYQDAWVNNQAYTKGEKAVYNGITYRASSDIDAPTGSDTNTVPSESSDWQAIAVARIFDHLSLTEAVRLYLNQSGNDNLNESVPNFIQLAEQDIYQKVNPPAQRKFVTRTVAADLTIDIPGNTSQIIGVRKKTTPVGSDTSSIEIVEADFSRFWETRASSGRVGEGLGAGDTYITPVYLYDNQKMYFAPDNTVDEGDEIELFLALAIDELGLTVENDAGTEVVVTSNWYTEYAPRALLYGALVHAQAFVKDTEQIQVWKNLYEEAIQEAMEYIERFEASDKSEQYLGSDYF